MTTAESRPRIAVISPFLDKGHGTERIVIEWMSRLDREFAFHVYSQQVEDVDLSRIVWHRIPRMPGPHLLNYLWWFGANHVWRAWHRRFGGMAYDVVFSPGVNCLDADVISVHIVFREFVRRVGAQLKLRRNPAWFWPRILHRRLYYALISFLEQRAYKNPETTLIVIAKKTLGDLDRLYRRREGCVLMYLGFDHQTYNPARRAELRETSRAKLGIGAERVQVLMVGNDWHKKGIRVLLEALRLLRDLPIDLLVVGRDEAAPFQTMAAERGLRERVRFLSPRKDVEFYYAASDIYAGPSLEDTFALPPVEAMACGLPAIVSRENGAYEIMSDGADGFILNDPTDSNSLAAIIRKLFESPELREGVGLKAAETARQFTWERNASDLAAIFEQIIHRKSQPQAQTLTQEL